MSNITHSLFILLLLTGCAISKFDFATAYKFKTIGKYPSLAEKNLKVLASPEQTLPNHLLQSKSKIIEITSLKSIAVVSEDIIHSKLSTYQELDNISRKDIRNNNKFNKIITRLGDIKLDTIIPESDYRVSSKEKQEAPKFNHWSLAGSLVLWGSMTLGVISSFINAFFPTSDPMYKYLTYIGLIISLILAFLGYRRGEQGFKKLLIATAISAIVFIFASPVVDLILNILL